MMMNLFRTCAVIAAGFVAMAMAQPAAAQQPSAAAVATAKNILAIKKADGMYKPVLVGVIERARTVLTEANLNLQKPLNEVAVVLNKEFASRADQVGDELAKRYAAEFTEQELKDLLAFYSTPVGRKSVETEPRVLQESMVYMEEWANKLSEEVITRFRQEMKKRGHDI